MSKITIHLIEPNTNAEISAEVDNEVRVEELMNAAIEYLNLPERHRHARIIYTLEKQSDSCAVNLINTIKEEGVQENDTLIIRSRVDLAPLLSLNLYLPDKDIRTVELEGGVDVRNLIDDLTGQLHLPPTDIYGRKLSYFLARENDGISLNEYISLIENGVKTGDTLIIREETLYEFDVFISYSHIDADWVYNWLVPELKQTGIRLCLDYENFKPGVPVLSEMERAVVNSKKVLLVISQNYLNSEYTEFENLLAQTLDPAAHRRHLIPLKISECVLPLRLQILTFIDFTDRDQWNLQLGRMLAAIRDEDLPTPVVKSDSIKTTAELISLTTDTRRCLWQESEDIWSWWGMYLFASHRRRNIPDMFPDLKRRFDSGHGWFFVQNEISKYRKYPKVITYGEESYKIQDYQSLPEKEKYLFVTVLRYLQSKIGSFLVPPVEQAARIISYSPERFYQEIIHNGWDYSSEKGFGFSLDHIQDVWPSDTELFKLRTEDRNLYNILEGFYYRFLRTSDPIFDFTLRNLSRKTLLITHAQLKIFLNWSYAKGPHGVGGLLPLDTYEMEIDFTKSLNILTLDPPIYVEPEKLCRFKIRVKDFYQRRTDNNTIAEFTLCEDHTVISSTGKFMLDY